MYQAVDMKLLFQRRNVIAFTEPLITQRKFVRKPGASIRHKQSDMHAFTFQEILNVCNPSANKIYITFKSAIVLPMHALIKQGRHNINA